MKVLLLISSAGYYGAEAVVVSLAKHLNALGAASTVGVFHNMHRPNLAVVDAAKREGLAVEVIPCKGRVDWEAVRAIQALIRREQVDVVHTHGYKAHAYGYLAVRSLSCPVVATCHGYSSHCSGKIARFRQRLYSVMEDFLLRRFNRVVTVSTLLVPFILAARVSPEKLTVIDNGIDFSEFASVRPSEDLESAKEGRLAVGVVGRLTAGKGHQRLFEAMPRVLSENPSVVLFVIGDGPLREALVALGKRLGIDSKLVFTGRRDDMPSVYAALDVVVLPSLYEGMPLVVLESLAASKAIIATQVGSISEVIRNEVTGLLVEPDNSASLAIAIRRLIADATMRQSLGANGHAFARDHFSAAAMTRKYLSVYESAMHD